MLILTLGVWLYSFANSFMRVRSIILTREADTEWVRELINQEQRHG
jgi:heme exporter protein C